MTNDNELEGEQPEDVDPGSQMPVDQDLDISKGPKRPRGPIEEEVGGSADEEKQWYILKVQSNRENSICDGLRRRVAVAGLDEYFGDILVPTEDVAEYKNGKRKVVKRKLYPGYIVCHMVINDDTWFLVRETPGIGDFTGASGKPTPMLPHEVDRIVKAASPEEESDEPIKTAIPFRVGDRVRIKEGTFENFEGDVEVIDEANGRVTVMINIFGRSTPVELEHWQVEAV
ncbi:MAG: transcription termination/antitermination protein NusG [Pirellulaceae bacterium]